MLRAEYAVDGHRSASFYVTLWVKVYGRRGLGKLLLTQQAREVVPQTRVSELSANTPYYLFTIIDPVTFYPPAATASVTYIRYLYGNNLETLPSNIFADLGALTHL